MTSSESTSTNTSASQQRVVAASDSTVSSTTANNNGRPARIPNVRRRSYADWITRAIQSSAEQKMTLAGIYNWMATNVPGLYEKRNLHSSKGWKVSFGNRRFLMAVWVCGRRVLIRISRSLLLLTEEEIAGILALFPTVTTSKLYTDILSLQQPLQHPLFRPHCPCTVTFRFAYCSILYLRTVPCRAI